MEINKAVDLLDNLIGMVDDNQGNDYDTAFHMAIDALKAQENKQSAQPETHEERTETHECDLISRQAAIRWVKTECNPYGKPTLDFESGKKVIEHLKQIPSAQPQRKKGKWLPDNNSLYEMRFVCSECKTSEVVPTIGFAKYKPIWDFCPNCGAEMEGGTE